MFTWAKLGLALAQLWAQFVIWMREGELLRSGAARAEAQGLKDAEAEEARARAARDKTDDGKDDPFVRD